MMATVARGRYLVIILRTIIYIFFAPDTNTPPHKPKGLTFLSASLFCKHTVFPRNRQGFPEFSTLLPWIPNRASQSRKIMPQIRGRPHPGGQKHASDPGQTYARGAETCPRFGADFTPVGRNVPEIRSRLHPGGQKRARDSGQTYARGAETCPRFRADLCTGGRDVPQIRGRLHPGGHRCKPAFRMYLQGGVSVSQRTIMNFFIL